jgi:hypothetical protein
MIISGEYSALAWYQFGVNRSLLDLVGEINTKLQFVCKHFQRKPVPVAHPVSNCKGWLWQIVRFRI